MWELDGRQLRQVFEVCRLGSMAAAARVLSISQPALSRAISRMEDKLGLPLFDRSGGGSTPTVYGEYIARRAGIVLAQTSSIAHDLSRIVSGEAGLVRIGLSVGISPEVATLLADNILQRYPKLSQHMQRGSRASLVEMLSRRELDMVVANLPRSDFAATYTVDKLPSAPVSWIVRAGHPLLSRHEPVTFSDILEYRLASPISVGLDDRDVLRNVPRERWANYRAFIASDFAVLRSHCLVADAVAVVPAGTFNADIGAGVLVQLDTTITNRVEWWVLTNQESDHSPVLRALRAMMINVAHLVVGQMTAQIEAKSRPSDL